ncbi:MAG: DUF7133 domain-containing protein, partial [Opitutaceae bacterium]
MISHPRPFQRRVLAIVAFSMVAVVTAQAQAPKSKAPAATPPTGAPPGIDPPEPFIPPNMFAIPDDLEVTLWAKSPQFRNPSNMDIDAQGRVWITEAYNYRRHIGKDPAGDRVMVLEDTDGDGKADRSSVFVQEPSLLAPLG